MDIRKNLSYKLREAKHLSGMKYQDLMEVTGLSKSAISLALNGGEQVGIETFQKLLDACDFEVYIDLSKK